MSSQIPPHHVTTTTSYLLHLDVLGGLLGEVLLGAVVQDALHSEASHSVDSWSDGEGVLREQLSTNGNNEAEALVGFKSFDLENVKIVNIVNNKIPFD